MHDDRIALPKEYWGKILIPNDSVDQGDPYFVKVARPGEPLVWYMYHTADGGVLGYRSRDLMNWEELGNVFESDPGRAHWAPCVGYYPEFEGTGTKPCRALVSRGEGLGAMAHVRHHIELWTADRMEGPFRFEKDLTPDSDFAIDGDVWKDPQTGEPRMAYAHNFYDEPVGTGVTIVRVKPDLTELIGEPIAHFRAKSSWQVYQKDRSFGPEFKLDLPDAFKDPASGTWVVKTWNCVEGWAGVYQNPTGRIFHVYSAGRFGSDDISREQGLEYGVGIVEQLGPGEFKDVTSETGRFMIRTDAEKGVVDPGHGNIVTGPSGEYYYGCHIRRERGSQRQAALFPIIEDLDGTPFCGMP